MDSGDVLVEEETEEASESSYTSAAEDAVEDTAHVSELIARREQLSKQVAEQVRFCYVFCSLVCFEFYMVIARHFVLLLNFVAHTTNCQGDKSGGGTKDPWDGSFYDGVLSRKFRSWYMQDGHFSGKLYKPENARELTKSEGNV